MWSTQSGLSVESNAELLGAGYVGFCILSTTSMFSEVLEPIVGIGDPIAGAREIVAVMLSGRRGVGMAELALDWVGGLGVSPALSAFILHNVVLGSGAIDCDWVTAGSQRKPALQAFAKGDIAV